MKFSVFTVSTPEYTQEEALALLKKYGYDGVEWMVHQMPKQAPGAPISWRKNNRCNIDVNTVTEHAKQIRALSDRYGIEIAAMGTYLFCNEYERADTCMRAAADMGCKRIRVNPLLYKGDRNYWDVFSESVDLYTALIPLAQKYGVKMNMEMHPGIISSGASAAYQIVSRFDSRYLGVIYDVGNMVAEGYEQYQMALEHLGEYLDHVHIKNQAWVKTGTLEDGTDTWAVQNVPIDKGSADLRKFLSALNAVGYEGFVSFEDFSTVSTTEEKLKFNISYIKKLMEEIKK